MTSAYLKTRFRTSHPVPHWPTEFVVLSAYATTGEVWTPERNARADSELAAELKARTDWIVRIVGYSPMSGHAEPSWAVELPLSEARAIGRRFQQDAIYHVSNDDLAAVPCKDQWRMIYVGSFRERLD